MTLLVFSLLCQISYAENWELNKDHSEILFQIPYMGVSQVNGRFKEFKADYVPEKSIEIKIETTSVDTGNKIRDGHLRGSDFFKSGEFPYIIFKSSSISKLRQNTYRASGLLSIRNVTKPTTIEFSVTDSLKDTWGYENKFVSFKSVINRSDFSLNWNKTLPAQKFLVGETVSFWGTFQIQPAQEKTPTTKHMIPDTSYIRGREMLARGERVKESIPNAPIVAPSLDAPVVVPRVAPAIPHNLKTNQENATWWMALVTIGLLGFFAVIMLSLYLKSMLSGYFSRHYAEFSLLGYLSDVIVILLVSLYSVAFWFVGWGVR